MTCIKHAVEMITHNLYVPICLQLPQAEMSCSYAALEQVKQVKQTASLEKGNR